MYTYVGNKGNKLYLRYFDEKGEVFETKEDFKPSLFIKANGDNFDKKGLLGDLFRKYEYTSISAMNDNIKDLNAMNQDIYGMEKPIYQYIRDYYPNRKPDFSKLKIYNFDIENIVVGGIDTINTPGKITAITLYHNLEDTYYVWATHENATWNRQNGAFKDTTDKIEYIECFDEIELLESFIRFWHNDPPHIITGWNIDGYDIPYTINRIKKVLGKSKHKKLSPFDQITDREFVNKFKQTQFSFNITGVSIMDYREVYLKFSEKKRDSYSLNNIGFDELEEEKLDYSEYNGLNDLYEKNFQTYIDYNIQDVKLVKRIEDKIRLMELAIMFAYDAGANFNDVFSPVKIWDCLIFNYAASKDLVIPPNKSISREDYGGGYCKKVKLGFSDWVMSFDLTSLYPHLIMGWNISPETLLDTISSEMIEATNSVSFEEVDGKQVVDIDHFFENDRQTDVLKEADVSMSPNGCFYSRDKEGILGIIIQMIFDERKKYKGVMLNYKQELATLKSSDPNSPEILKLQSQYSRNYNMQYSRKILMNSLYGCLGNPHFRYTDYDNALAITSAGQLAIRFIEVKLNDFINKFMKNEVKKDYCIAIDTDSVYFEFNDLVKKHMNGWSKEKIINGLDQFAKKKLEPFIDKSYRELADMMNCFDHKLFMDREVITEKAVWTAKKRYAMTVWDNEGVRYDEPELKVQGIEVVKSDTPAVIREELKESLRIILTKEEEDLLNFIEDVKSKYDSLPIETVATPKGITNVDKYVGSNGKRYIKGAQSHIKSAINYNYMLRKNPNLIGKYDFIRGGDKIKFVQLKVPNPLQDNVIGFIDVLPPEFGLDKYVDYTHQWEKTFIKPLDLILEKIDWKHERTSSDLNDFFI